MRRLLSTIVAALFMGASIGFLAPHAMAAETNCDQVVVDDAQVFDDAQSDVEQAATQLSNLGADVRVRTIQTFGSFPNLDKYYKEMQLNCPSWTGTGSNPKENLLVFLLSLGERKQAIFYGDRWKPAFDQSGGDLRIQSNFMGPNFAAGNFGRGFVEGMQESYRVIDIYMHPPVNSGAEPVVVNKEATDFSGLWKVLGWLFGALVLFGGLFFLYLVLKKRREADEERRTMRQRALSARDAASKILQEVGDSTRKTVRNAKVAKYSQIGGNEAAVLTSALQAVEFQYDSATNGMAAAASASANEEDGHLTTGEYEQLAGRYEAVLEDARAAQKADKLIDTTCSELEAALQRVFQDILSVQSALDQLNASVGSLKNEGIKVDAISDHIVVATAALGRAQENSTDLSALKHLYEAQDKLKDGQDAVSTLADQRQKLSEGIPDLKTRTVQTLQTLESARACFERVSKTYAPSSWEAVQGNGTEAEKRISDAEVACNKAAEQSEMQHQAWEVAIESLQEGNLLLDKAQSLLRSITQLEGSLAVAKEQAPQEIEAAQADIDKASEYLSLYDEDIRDEVEEELSQAREILNKARKELAKSLPDYFVVVKLATAANSAVDTVYEECVEEHEAAERLRRKAATTLTQAETAVSKAEEFIDDHRSDVGSSAESDLRQAQQALQQARAQRDPAGVLDYAQSALQDGKSAYKKAKNDFDNAEEARTPIVIVSTPSYSSSSSWGSSSGGFGSSFGGGGGGSSMSFGGGGGGGSSSGW